MKSIGVAALHGELGIARARAGEDEQARLRRGGIEEAAKAFESMFIKMLLDAMPEAEDSVLSGGFGGGVWRDMLHREYADQAAQQQGFGIADAIIRQLGQPQSAADQPLTPLPGQARMSSQYGDRIHPLTGEHHQHSGVDFAAPLGAPVRAVLGAEVVFAGPKGNYGNLVELRHSDGTTTRYAHLDRIEVQKGQRLKRGDRLGTVGSTGQSTGPHLHFEVRRQGKTVDPQAFLGQHSGPVAHR